MSRLEALMKRLPPELEGEVADFVEFLLVKYNHTGAGQPPPLRMDWAGALADWKDKYTSVELQHKTLEWMTEDAVGGYERPDGDPAEPVKGE